jgi:drug/metabolite transporter (DMT)-like permease
VIGALTRLRTASPESIGLAAGLVTICMWGSGFVAIRAADAWFSPGTIALGRLIVSCAVLTVVAIARRDALPPRRDLLQIGVYGALWLGGYSLLLNASERTIDAATAAMLVNAGPIVIAILAGLFLRDGFPTRLFVGCAIAFAGCALIALATTRSAPTASAGLLLCVAATLAYAVAVVVQKPVLARVGGFQVTFFGCVFALAVCLPFFPTMTAEVSKAPLDAVAWIVYLGVFPTALGFGMWNIALRSTTAGRAGALNLLVPVVALLLGWLLLGEVPPWLALVGGAVSLAGVYVARLKPAARAQPRSHR